MTFRNALCVRDTSRERRGAMGAVAHQSRPGWQIYSCLLQFAEQVRKDQRAARAKEVVGRSEMVYEVVGKPLDLDKVVAAVKEASKARAIPRGQART